MDLSVTQAEYSHPFHAAELVRLLDSYARDPMGGGAGLSDYAKENVVRELARHPGAFSVLAWNGRQAIGLANCFLGFSTFRCRPLVNIHDMVVLPEFRGRGVGRRLLEQVEELARQRGCCKLTLEVLEGNRGAQAVYRNFGFAGYQLKPETGRALFWQKDL